jgi:two-component system, NarL family, nitrate/nitrite response regulator NarL
VPDPEPALTRREVEMLGLAAAGYQNRAIAAELGLAEQTVKNHMSRILHKLGAADRTHAVVEALRLELIALPSEEPDGASTSSIRGRRSASHVS